ncbi:hydroxyacid dehydrogenase [Fructobacillus sp. M1-13]|uniref:Hydroxyacid dehydrogenase n=1 Tax=Fructobacillus papyriferae TaxID=2713171 RepID=A0ABS5QSL5_9LACO|nr:NAD(P)-dependent oxidoreductase [Fructobacillus papyriferae]MBS9335371.1 hydroxyacid dehydrogenase [Fructobacillus papyriferae]MCD2158960.1 hydroxyacid dehydrogenase [Fructobacillus papyriferae]
MTQKILVFDGIDDSAIKELQEAGYEVVSNPQAKADDFAGDPDVVGILLMMYKIDGAVMDRYPNLKVIARHGVGYDNVDLEAAKERGIVVANTPGANATAVAETAVALMLMAGRLYDTDKRGISDEKAKSYAAGHPGVQVSHKVVGILGFGHIGRQVAELLSGFGVKVLAYARHDKDVPNGRMADLDEIFEKADFVVSTLPATPATTKLIGETAFKKMKQSAVLVNVGRGPVVDEEALIIALKAGEIAAAGLDVVEKEPISPDNELLHMDNTYVLPHVAGGSLEAKEEIAATAAKNIIDVLAGKGTKNQVN